MQIDTTALSTALVDAVLAEYPDVQAVYLFGSFADDTARRESDVDVAVLLPPDRARVAGSLALGDLHTRLVDVTGRDVDLVNLRTTSTVLQAVIVTTARRIHCADEIEADDFEMQAMTRYQHLCRERREIVEAGRRDGFYAIRPR